MFSPYDYHNTYSIVARDPNTGHMGVAVQTHQVGVGRIVAWMRPGLGAVATQSLVNISYGPMALAMLAEGLSAPDVLTALLCSDSKAHRRQVGIIDASGQVAAHTGEGCIAEAGHYVGDNFSVQANMMTRPTVIDAMRRAYERTGGDLAVRMVAALEAAQAEDGDIRGMQSASIKIVSGSRDDRDWETVFDLRVDESEQPVKELKRLVTIRRAQLLDAEGHRLLAAGETVTALNRWREARELAPDQEELAFWQGVTLTNTLPIPEAISIAGRIIAPVFKDDPRRDEWLDLIRRLGACGLIEEPGRADQLLAAISDES